MPDGARSPATVSPSIPPKFLIHKVLGTIKSPPAMGNFEKLVLLVVLFVGAIVLAISLNQGSGAVQAAGPLDAQALDSGLLPGPGATPGAGERARLDEETSRANPWLGAEPAGLNPSTPAPEDDAGLLLNAGQEEPSSLAADPVSDTSHRILHETNGLRPSFLDDYMVYVAVEGDTWSGLAQRFYQDGRYTRNLHLANEDVDELVPGRELLVPVFDFIESDAGLRSPTEPVRPPSSGAQFAAEPPSASAPERTTSATTKTSGPAKPVSAGGEYVVRAGDTLSDISLAALGTVTRWQEIFELNRDVLKKPEALQVGMKLRLPAGAAPVSQATGSAGSKPVAKSTPAKTESAPKKKKVD